MLKALSKSQKSLTRKLRPSLQMLSLPRPSPLLSQKPLRTTRKMLPRMPRRTSLRPKRKTEIRQKTQTKTRKMMLQSQLIRRVRSLRLRILLQRKKCQMLL